MESTFSVMSSKALKIAGASPAECSYVIPHSPSYVARIFGGYSEFRGKMFFVIGIVYRIDVCFNRIQSFVYPSRTKVTQKSSI